jgi:echinoderm microtubule-associated protein-like 6
MLQTNDGAYEILYWDSSYLVGRQHSSAFDMRDVDWHTFSCVLGWPVQGIWPKDSDGTDVNAVDRSNSKTLIVTAEDTFAVRLMRYPCLKGCDARTYAGHMSHVMNVRFTANDSRVISVGGNDACAFQWRHVDPKSGNTVFFSKNGEARAATALLQ